VDEVVLAARADAFPPVLPDPNPGPAGAKAITDVSDLNFYYAARVSDVTAFFRLGRLIETNRTDRIFTAPAETLTEDYVTGRFG
jgi:hypothetical protein